MSRGETTRTRSQDEGAIGEARPDLPRLVVALSCHQPLAAGMRISLGGADEVQIGRGTKREIERTGRRVDLVLDDDAMSRRHAVLRRMVGGWELADAGSKNGTAVNGDRYMRTTLADGDVIEVGATMMVFRERGANSGAVHDPGDRVLDPEVEPTASVALRTLAIDFELRVSELVQIGQSKVTVLVRGETGTGKELIARAVHSMSGRRGPFIAINCGALPRTLVESELFGYRRGAFSGAAEDREGLVRRAHGGTLFLDEVAELPAESQVALLRVLQEGEVRPIGAGDLQAVDVRVVAATHQDILRRIADGSFRQDLYARLAGFELVLPPLRERREDLGILVAAILQRMGGEAARVTLHRRAARALLAYDYPLNVRELEQALRAAVVFARGGQICIEHLPEGMRGYRSAASMGLLPEHHALRERLIEILRETHGNVAAAGRAMNKAPMQVRRWCRRFGIDLASFR